MPMFDYKGEDARELASLSYHLAAYGSMAAYGPKAFMRYAEMGAPPKGWRDLAPHELGLSGDRLDILGNYEGEGPVFDGLLSAQAKVLVEEDAAGNATRVAISYAGTSNATDAIEFMAMADGSYVFAFDYLLDALKGYAQANGLGGEDVIVTGYSLGAGATNSMYLHKAGHWDGFYETSDYIGAAVPVIHVDDLGIMNIGFENDVVHRGVGQGGSGDSVRGFMYGNDREYVSSTDNMIYFDDAYASPLWPYGGKSLLNLTNWSAHLTAVFTNAIDVVINSNFYDFIERDSVVLVQGLSDAAKPLFWMEDKQTSTSDHFNNPGFLLGSEQADKISDSAASDFLDGFGGNDTFRIKAGDDTVHGGAGRDTVELKASPFAFEFVGLSDGSLFAITKNDILGVNEFIEVEKINFQWGVLGLWNQTWTVQDDRLVLSGKRPIDFVAHDEGTAGDDVLLGTAGRNRLFGMEGDDQIDGGFGNDLLVGGTGNDILEGSAGNDVLLGGAGDDHLVGGSGNDRMSGGVGDDLFDLTGGVNGRDIISDFNHHDAEADQIAFSSADFTSAQDVLDAARQFGNKVIIDYGFDSVSLTLTRLSDLSIDDFVII